MSNKDVNIVIPETNKTKRFSDLIKERVLSYMNEKFLDVAYQDDSINTNLTMLSEYYYNINNKIDRYKYWIDGNELLQDFYKYLNFAIIYKQVPSLPGFCFYNNITPSIYAGLKDNVYLQEAYESITAYIESNTINLGYNKNDRFSSFMLSSKFGYSPQSTVVNVATEDKQELKTLSDKELIQQAQDLKLIEKKED